MFENKKQIKLLQDWCKEFHNCIADLQAEYKKTPLQML